MSVPRNEILYREDFRRDVFRLPAKIQDRLAELIEILRENPFDSRLHAKRLGPPLHGAFSFRITRDYRVGFEFVAPHSIRLLVADRRDSIYKRMKRLL